VAVPVVERLEVVDVEHDDRKRPARAQRPVPLHLENQLKPAAVRHLGERVDQALLMQLAVEQAQVPLGVVQALLDLAEPGQQDGGAEGIDQQGDEHGAEAEHRPMLRRVHAEQQHADGEQDGAGVVDHQRAPGALDDLGLLLRGLVAREGKDHQGQKRNHPPDLHHASAGRIDKGVQVVQRGGDENHEPGEEAGDAVEVAVFAGRHRQQPQRRRDGEGRVLPQIEQGQLPGREGAAAEVVVHEQRDVDQDDGHRGLRDVRDEDRGRVLVLAHRADCEQGEDAVDQIPEVRRNGRALHTVANEDVVGVTSLAQRPGDDADTQQAPLVPQHVAAPPPAQHAGHPPQQRRQRDQNVRDPRRPADEGDKKECHQHQGCKEEGRSGDANHGNRTSALSIDGQLYYR